ncbi:hypothetical protein C8R45DRAFT_849331, partial [Mycena sanguinolenta]
ESEDEVRETGKRGPKSETRDHFDPPVAVKLNGEKRWSFKCRHCKTTLTVAREVSNKQLFGDEKPAPRLGNLATHITNKHAGEPVPSDVQPGEIRGVSATSAKIMADFLLEGKIYPASNAAVDFVPKGKLNPAINSTQKNFLKVFAAWIIEDDLPFTTGETPGIHRLFAFLQTRYGLPSDTTAIDAWVLDRAELRALWLKPEDWKFLESLGEVLKARFIPYKFTAVTKEMCRSRTPTLPWVLPMYEGMRKHLRNTTEAAPYTSLRTAAEAALEKLESYYSKACNSQLNIVATCTFLAPIHCCGCYIGSASPFAGYLLVPQVGPGASVERCACAGIIGACL